MNTRMRVNEPQMRVSRCTRDFCRSYQSVYAVTYRCYLKPCKLLLNTPAPRSSICWSQSLEFGSRHALKHFVQVDVLASIYPLTRSVDLAVSLHDRDYCCSSDFKPTGEIEITADMQRHLFGRDRRGKSGIFGFCHSSPLPGRASDSRCSL